MTAAFARISESSTSTGTGSIAPPMGTGFRVVGASAAQTFDPVSIQVEDSAGNIAVLGPFAQ